jgi:hypothetical protein
LHEPEAEFPVKQRGRIRASCEELKREGALLIDSFAEDPGESIDFDENGTAIGKTERGVKTIEMISLNRKELLDKRKQAIGSLGRSDFKIILTNREFAGCLSAVLRSRRGTKGAAPRKLPIATSSTTGPDSFQYIRRVTIRNFRAIQSVTIEIPQGLTGSSTTGQGWKVVLGENSSGKSTVLKAIALAIIGQVRANELHLNPSDMLRRWKNPDGTVGRARKGHIKLEFLGGLNLGVEFDRSGIRFKNGAIIREVTTMASISMAPALSRADESSLEGEP